MFLLIHVENLAIENGTITMHSKCVICPDNFQDRKLFDFRLFKYSHRDKHHTLIVFFLLNGFWILSHKRKPSSASHEKLFLVLLLL